MGTRFALPLVLPGIETKLWTIAFRLSGTRPIQRCFISTITLQIAVPIVCDEMTHIGQCYVTITLARSHKGRTVQAIIEETEKYYLDRITILHY